MRSAKELIGKPIFSITNGRRLGSVKDLYIDSNFKKVTGIYTGSEGIFNRKALLIPGEQVTVYGVDAVLVADTNVTKDDREYLPSQSWLRRESVQGRMMYTSGGTKVASVGDLLLNNNSDIVALSLARVFVEGPISENRIVPRAAVIDPGGFDGTMIIDLSQVEQSNMDLLGSVESLDIESSFDSGDSTSELEEDTYGEGLEEDRSG